MSKYYNIWERIMGKWMWTTIVIFTLSSIFTLAPLSGASFVFAADEEEEEYIIRTKKITGEISMIKSHFISIIYAQDKKAGTENEAVFLLNDEIEFRLKDLEDLQSGDKISITYDEYFEIELNEKGEEEEKFVKREAREIRFLSTKSGSGLRSG